VWLDATTFIPHRIEIEHGRPGACDARSPVEREQWTITAQQLAPTFQNQRPLMTANWPTASFELNDKRVE
jgi:hypothetical protein